MRGPPAPGSRKEIICGRVLRLDRLLHEAVKEKAPVCRPAG